VYFKSEEYISCTLPSLGFKRTFFLKQIQLHDIPIHSKYTAHIQDMGDLNLIMDTLNVTYKNPKWSYVYEGITGSHFILDLPTFKTHIVETLPHNT